VDGTGAGVVVGPGMGRRFGASVGAAVPERNESTVKVSCGSAARV
jgi:hypothetical protein